MLTNVAPCERQFGRFWIPSTFHAVRAIAERTLDDPSDVDNIEDVTLRSVHKRWTKLELAGVEKWDPHRYAFKIAFVNSRQMRNKQWRRTQQGRAVFVQAAHLDAPVRDWALSDSSLRVERKEVAGILAEEFGKLTTAERDLVLSASDIDRKVSMDAATRQRLHRLRARLRDRVERRAAMSLVELFS